MASVSVSHMIIFIASIVVAASVAGVLAGEVNRLSDSIGDQGLDASQKIQSDILVISDAGSDSCCYDDGEITLLVKNTGSRRLPADPDQLDVIVNGQYETNVTIDVVDDDLWMPGSVIELGISHELSSGDHRVKIVIPGDEEVFEFRT